MPFTRSVFNIFDLFSSWSNISTDPMKIYQNELAADGDGDDDDVTTTFYFELINYI